MSNTQLLPSIADIRRRCQALAMLDAIICPQWEHRYFSFDAHWGQGEQMGSMRDGSGDEWFIYFGPFGAAIKGLAHKSDVTSNQQFAVHVQRQVPSGFSSFLNEPAFRMDWASYCYWRAQEDQSWHKVTLANAEFAKVDDGSAEHLAILNDPASSYVEFASSYFEVDLPLEMVEHIYRHNPLTGGLISALNGDITLAQAQEFSLEAGYPLMRPDA